MLAGDILFSLLTAIINTVFTAPIFTVIAEIWGGIYNTWIAPA
jgi:hypothetical protein